MNFKNFSWNYFYRIKLSLESMNVFELLQSFDSVYFLYFYLHYLYRPKSSFDSMNSLYFYWHYLYRPKSSFDSKNFLYFYWHYLYRPKSSFDSMNFLYFYWNYLYRPKSSFDSMNFPYFYWHYLRLMVKIRAKLSSHKLLIGVFRVTPSLSFIQHTWLFRLMVGWPKNSVHVVQLGRKQPPIKVRTFYWSGCKQMPWSNQHFSNFKEARRCLCL